VGIIDINWAVGINFVLMLDSAEGFLCVILMHSNPMDYKVDRYRWHNIAHSPITIFLIPEC